MKITFLLTILFCLPLFAQHDITFYSGISSTEVISNINSIPSELVDWHTGINVGISSNIRLFSIFYITPAFEYISSKFDKSI